MAKRTDAEKQAWREQMAALAASIKAMPEQDRINYAFEHPVLTCEGHPLSPYNTCAIIMQAQLAGIAVTQVAGFRQWKKIGRQVQKGQHSCGCILVPMGKGKAASEADADPDGKTKGSMRFRWVPMFDVTQTELVTDSPEVLTPDVPRPAAGDDWPVEVKGELVKANEVDALADDDEYSMEPGPHNAPPEIEQAIRESYAVEMKPTGLLF